MTPLSSKPEQAAAAEAKLARLGAQVDAMQGMLVRLLQEVVRAEKRLRHSETQSLAEVNEQLVVAALTSQADAEAATRALGAATQSATHDLLTGVPNRLMLLDHFALAAAAARRHNGRCALLFLDLDDFKSLNDTHGHALGDRVLQQTARRLVESVREVDTVSRHGGDEFLVLLTELDQPGDAQGVADKLAKAVAAPMELDGVQVATSVSIGLAIHPDDGEDFDTLVTHADAAMYAAKRQRATQRGPAVVLGEAVAPQRLSGPRPMNLDRGMVELPPHDGHAAARPGPSHAERLLVDLREANEHLVLAALDAQALQTAAENARQRQAALLSAAVDELRNPKAPIRLAAMMLGRPAADEALLPRIQQIVGQQIEHLERLSDAVKLEHGELHLKRAPVDMNELLEQSLTVHRIVMDARGQELTVVRPTGPLEVMGDADWLRLVLSNLLDNASRYTHEGGRIDVSLSTAAGMLRLVVSDNGIGIAPPLLPLVFEPFVQDPQALASSGCGLGIGLTAAQSLARANGGDITAESAGVNRGSRFVLTLPLATGQERVPRSDSTSTSALGGQPL